MPDPPEPKPVRSVGRAALGGIGWIGAGTAVAKVASLIAQFALGWLLAEGDYAVFAAAIAVTGVVGALRNGGVAKLLVQRREDYADIAWPLTRVALGFNLLGGAIVAGLAWPVSQQIGEPVVMWLMLLLAAAFPLNTAPTILQARLRSELRFKDLTVITMCSTILRYGSMIAFAALGLGPFSFVLPQILATGFEWVAMRRAVGGIPRPNPDAPPQTVALLHKLKWILATTFAVAFSANGVYLIISFLRFDILGVYFFGFRLTVAVSQLFTQNLIGVILPTFVRLKDDPDRQRAALFRAARLLTHATAPICLAGCVMAHPLIDTAWQGKWTESVVVVQWMLLALVPRLVGSVGVSALESMGRWRTQAALTYLDGISLAATVAVTLSLDGGLREVATAAAVQRLVAGLVYVAAPALVLGVHPGRLVIQALGPLSVYLALAATLLALGYASPQQWLPAIATAAGLVIGWALLALTVYRDDTLYLLRLVTRRG